MATGSVRNDGPGHPIGLLAVTKCVHQIPSSAKQGNRGRLAGFPSLGPGCLPGRHLHRSRAACDRHRRWVEGEQDFCYRYRPFIPSPSSIPLPVPRRTGGESSGASVFVPGLCYHAVPSLLCFRIAPSHEGQFRKWNEQLWAYCWTIRAHRQAENSGCRRRSPSPTIPMRRRRGHADADPPVVPVQDVSRAPRTVHPAVDHAIGSVLGILPLTWAGRAAGESTKRWRPEGWFGTGPRLPRRIWPVRAAIGGDTGGGCPRVARQRPVLRHRCSHGVTG